MVVNIIIRIYVVLRQAGGRARSISFPRYKTACKPAIGLQALIRMTGFQIGKAGPTLKLTQCLAEEAFYS